MKISVLVAQFPISLSIQKNLTTMLELLEKAHPGELVVMPEGALSGYRDDLSFLGTINHQEIQDSLVQLRTAMMKRKIHLWFGSLIQKEGNWVNAGFGFTPDGDDFFYEKINLAYHERGIVTPGNALPVFPVAMEKGEIKIGVQLCRELRFPEQWGLLARKGAQIIIHLNNAIGNPQQRPVWRSHLISRAAETQRFVISANNAGAGQLCPTMIIAPNGEVLGEVVAESTSILRAEFNLDLVSDWYLGQCREDVVTIRSTD